MNEKYNMECPVCLGMDERGHKLIMKYNSDDGNFSLLECPICDVQFWVPFKNPSADWYHKKYVFDESKNKETERDAFYKFINNRKLAGKKLLDIGCGTGDFLSLAKRKGAYTFGLDFNKDVINFAINTNKLDNLSAITSIDDLNKYPSGNFDFVTLFEVVEHLDNPLDWLLKIRNSIKDGGIFALSTPNRSRWFRNFDSFDRPPNHLSRWNRKSLFKLLDKAGFRVIRYKKLNDIDLFLSTILGILRGNTPKVNEGSPETVTSRPTLLLIIKKVFLKLIFIISKLKSFLGVGNTLYVEVLKAPADK